MMFFCYKNKYINYNLLLKLFLCLTFFFSYEFIYINLYASSKDFLNLKSEAAVVIDYDSGRVLYDKNSDTIRPMASLTKIMTSILLVENCNMDELIEVPKEATWIGRFNCGVKKRR